MAEAEWFAALYRSCYRRLVLACYAVTADLGVAQEVAREAFVTAYGWRARVAAAERPEEWVLTVAVGLANRRRRGRALRDRMLRPWSQSVPEGELVDDRTDLHRAVRALAEEQRTVVVLHHLADLRVVEVASLLDLPEETVMARLSQARMALAAALGPAPDHADLDRRLAALREDLHGSVRQPDVAAVAARWRARVWGRRRKLGAALAVLVVAATIPLLRTTLRPVPGEEPGIAAEPPPSVEPTTSFVYDVDVAIDRQVQGYALRAVCPARSQTGPCTTEVLYTEDGAFWAIQSRLPAPGSSAARGLDRRIQTLGPRTVVIEARTERWYSGDSALTWRRVPVEPGASVAAIPPGAVLEARCFVVTSVCRGLGQMLVTLPDSGRSATLANPPALDQLVPARIPAADGGWWVSGKDPATGRWSLAVSRDAGRSWSITPLPPLAGTPEAGIAVTATPNALYATAIGPLPDTAAGLLAIFRSTDAGATWTAAWQAHDGRQPRSLAATLIAAPDGSVTVTTQDGGSYVSTDGAATFHQDTGPARYARWTRVGYIASFGGTSRDYTWSRDGSHWYDFTVG
jgi:DNA-directed RNA polymerase specialized sigma24 family protein